MAMRQIVSLQGAFESIFGFTTHYLKETDSLSHVATLAINIIKGFSSAGRPIPNSKHTLTLCEDFKTVFKGLKIAGSVHGFMTGEAWRHRDTGELKLFRLIARVAYLVCDFFATIDLLAFFGVISKNVGGKVSFFLFGIGKETSGTIFLVAGVSSSLINQLENVYQNPRDYEAIITIVSDSVRLLQLCCKAFDLKVCEAALGGIGVFVAFGKSIYKYSQS